MCEVSMPLLRWPNFFFFPTAMTRDDINIYIKNIFFIFIFLV